MLTPEEYRILRRIMVYDCDRHLGHNYLTGFGASKPEVSDVVKNAVDERIARIRKAQAEKSRGN